MEYLLQLGAGHGNEARVWAYLRFMLRFVPVKYKTRRTDPQREEQEAREKGTKHILYAYEMLIQSLF